MKEKITKQILRREIDTLWNETLRGFPQAKRKDIEDLIKNHQRKVISISKKITPHIFYY